jgi:hypothetical protein
MSGPIAAALLALAVVINAPAAGADVVVSVAGGAGVPGGTASATFSLTGGGGNVATVGFDVLFDTNVLAIQTSNCTLAPRLTTTHTLSVFLPQAGRLRLGIFDLNPPLNSFDDGDLATCTFDISATAALGDTQLTMVLGADAVSDNSVPPVVLPSTGANGAITVASALPTSTVSPTATNTPVQPTQTPTNTQGQQATNTPTSTRTNTPGGGGPTNTPTNTPQGQATSTPTATRTRTPTGPTPTNTSGTFGEGGGCNISASSGADVGPLAWLIVPAALLLRRRRAQR